MKIRTEEWVIWLRNNTSYYNYPVVEGEKIKLEEDDKRVWMKNENKVYTVHYYCIIKKVERKKKCSWNYGRWNLPMVILSVESS